MGGGGHVTSAGALELGADLETSSVDNAGAGVAAAARAIAVPSAAGVACAEVVALAAEADCANGASQEGVLISVWEVEDGGAGASGTWRAGNGGRPVIIVVAGRGRRRRACVLDGAGSGLARDMGGSGG